MFPSFPASVSGLKIVYVDEMLWDQAILHGFEGPQWFGPKSSPLLKKKWPIRERRRDHNLWAQLLSVARQRILNVSICVATTEHCVLCQQIYLYCCSIASKSRHSFYKVPRTKFGTPWNNRTAKYSSSNHFKQNLKIIKKQNLIQIFLSRNHPLWTVQKPLKINLPRNVITPKKQEKTYVSQKEILSLLSPKKHN